MLWYKNWLETRWSFFFAVALSVLPMLVAEKAQNSLPGADGFIQSMGAFWLFAPAMLAGAGIRTRSGFRGKGVHGSMYYTLSMPVSRAKLFVVRVSLGFLELAGVIAAVSIGAWLALPVLRHHADPSEMLRYGLVVLGCASGLYFMAVLAASLIDDEIGKTWGSFLGGAILMLIVRRLGIPPSFDVLGAILTASPLHSAIPWNAMAVSAGMSLVLGLAALKTVQRREYSA